MLCPACHAAMTAMTLEGHLGTSVTIDVCEPCQAIWFDGRESLQLSAGSTLRLFRLIGERAARERPRPFGACGCARCSAPLTIAHDMQRTTRFQYLRCPAGHGRLIGFLDFLREKDFIRPLSPAQIDTLRRNLQTVSCSSCGAPIDLARSSACEHCGAPLSMIDFEHASQLIAELQGASVAAAPAAPSGHAPMIDPALPMRLAQARREVATSFAAFDQDPSWFADVSASNLIAAGFRAVSRWMAK